MKPFLHLHVTSIPAKHRETPRKTAAGISLSSLMKGLKEYAPDVAGGAVYAGASNFIPQVQALNSDQKALTALGNLPAGIVLSRLARRRSFQNTIAPPTIKGRAGGAAVIGAATIPNVRVLAGHPPLKLKNNVDEWRENVENLDSVVADTAANTVSSTVQKMKPDLDLKLRDLGLSVAGSLGGMAIGDLAGGAAARMWNAKNIYDKKSDEKERDKSIDDVANARMMGGLAGSVIGSVALPWVFNKRGPIKTASNPIYNFFHPRVKITTPNRVLSRARVISAMALPAAVPGAKMLIDSSKNLIDTSGSKVTQIMAGESDPLKNIPINSAIDNQSQIKDSIATLTGTMAAPTIGTISGIGAGALVNHFALADNPEDSIEKARAKRRTKEIVLAGGGLAGMAAGAAASPMLEKALRGLTGLIPRLNPI